MNVSRAHLCTVSRVSRWASGAGPAGGGGLGRADAQFMRKATEGLLPPLTPRKTLFTLTGAHLSEIRTLYAYLTIFNSPFWSPLLNFIRMNSYGSLKLTQVSILFSLSPYKSNLIRRIQINRNVKVCMFELHTWTFVDKVWTEWINPQRLK